jgi:hypothetical protein
MYHKKYDLNCNFAFVLNGRETSSLTFSEAHRLKVLENRVLRRIFERRKYETIRGWRKSCIVGSFIIFTFQQILLRLYHEG